MKTISDPNQLEAAWSQQYARLAEHFSRMLPEQGVLVEIGCGRGQLTIPLAERILRWQIIGVDRFKGPYSDSRAELLSVLANRGRKIGIKVEVSDYSMWLASQADSKYDAIISSEFLPEIDSESTRDFLIDCYRVIKAGGRTFHSFLSPEPRNARQRRLIDADSNPRWTKTPPKEWFSPPPSKVREYLELAGFKRVRLTRLRSGLVIRSDAARELLKDWDIRQSYWKSHHRALEKEGLEVPDWIIISAAKIRP
jgi:cyclopropane fatty-acyl-phospholipid synthase-like methyltransferase